MARIEVAIRLLKALTKQIEEMDQKIQEQARTIDRIQGLVDELDNRL